MAFVDGKVLVWGRDSSVEKARVIGIRERRLYRLLTPPPQALVHMDIPSKLWHRRYGHLHYNISHPKSNGERHPQLEGGP